MTAKAYTIVEFEVIDQKAMTEWSSRYQPMVKAAGARNLQTGFGRVVGLDGTPPKHITILEWDSLEKAQAFLHSHDFKKIEPMRDKALKMTRRFIVEATA